MIAGTSGPLWTFVRKLIALAGRRDLRLTKANTARDEGNRRLDPDLNAALPLFLPTLLVGAAFGALAVPAMGVVAPVVMSAVVFAGAAQFGALGILVAGGGTAAAVGAGLLINTRFLSMGFAVAPSWRGGRISRALQGQLVVDASVALANRGDGRFDRKTLVVGTGVQAVGWISGTALGVILGDRVPSPEALGLDAVFPVFYLALLWPELREPRARVAAALALVIVLIMQPVAPPGVPILLAGAAALIGLMRP